MFKTITKAGAFLLLGSVVLGGKRGAVKDGRRVAKRKARSRSINKVLLLLLPPHKLPKVRLSLGLAPMRPHKERARIAARQSTRQWRIRGNAAWLGTYPRGPMVTMDDLPFSCVFQNVRPSGETR